MQNLSTVSGARDGIIVLANFCYGVIHLVSMHKRGGREEQKSTSCVQGGGVTTSDVYKFCNLYALFKPRKSQGKQII